MSYKGFDYVLGAQLARKLPKLPAPPQVVFPTRIIKTVICIEHIESCSEPESEASLEAVSTPSAKWRPKKKRSVHFEGSTNSSSGDDSGLSSKPSNLCSTCGKRKSILKNGGKQNSPNGDTDSDKLHCCSTCSKKPKGDELKGKDQREGKDNTLIQNTKKDQIPNRTLYLNRPTATSLRNSFDSLQPANRTQQLINRVKLHGMVQHILQPSRADVVRREDVVEQPSDPRPNAFFDQRSGFLRVYHGPTYGNPYGSLHGNPGNPNPIGTFLPTFGGGGFGYPSPYPNSPMHNFQQTNNQQTLQHCHCHQCNQQEGTRYQENLQPQNGPSTPRITSNGNLNNSKQPSPAGNGSSARGWRGNNNSQQSLPGGNNKSNRGWGGNNNGGPIPGAWDDGPNQNRRGSGGNNNNNTNSSDWGGNQVSSGRGENSWGNVASNRNDDSKTNNGCDDSWNNNSTDKAGSSNWDNNDWGNPQGDNSKNDSSNNDTSSSGGGDNWNSWNSYSGGNSGNNEAGNSSSGDAVNGAGSSGWGEDSNNKPSSSNSGGNDTWGAPANQDPWADRTATEATNGGGTPTRDDNWNSGDNSGGDNWGGNSRGEDNNGGAWATQTALSGGSWADAGTGPTSKNAGW